jgi:hypothetical protein
MIKKETGNITIFNVIGNNVVIKRKNGEEIKLEPAEKSTLTEFFNKIPKIKNGDIIITGTGSTIVISSNWDSGKTEPNKNYESEKSMNLTIAPNSKAMLSTTSWNQINKKTNVNIHGQGIIKVELIKGIFSINAKGIEVTTPTAYFKEPKISAIEVLNDGTTYLIKLNKMEINNKITGKTYFAKSTGLDEIIITKDAIYRKPSTKIDERISSISGALIVGSGSPIFNTKDSIELMSRMLDPLKNQDTLKNPESFMNNAMASIEMFNQMSKEDMEKLGLSKNQIKDMNVGLKNFNGEKRNEKMKNINKKMKEVGKQFEGFTPEHAEKFKEITKYKMQKAQPNLKKHQANVIKIYESLPAYSPLESQYKVA